MHDVQCMQMAASALISYRTGGVLHMMFRPF